MRDLRSIGSHLRTTFRWRARTEKGPSKPPAASKRSSPTSARPRGTSARPCGTSERSCGTSATPCKDQSRPEMAFLSLRTPPQDLAEPASDGAETETGLAEPPLDLATVATDRAETGTGVSKMGFAKERIGTGTRRRAPMLRQSPPCASNPPPSGLGAAFPRPVRATPRRDPMALEASRLLSPSSSSEEWGRQTPRP